MDKLAPRSRVDIDEITADLGREKKRSLNYANTNFSNTEAVMLAARFFITESAMYVLLNDNHIEDHGIEVLSNALKSQSTVRFLNVSNNPFGDRGILALAELQKERPDLKIKATNFEERLAHALSRRARLHAQSDSEDDAVGAYADNARSTRHTSRAQDRTVGR